MLQLVILIKASTCILVEGVEEESWTLRIQWIALFLTLDVAEDWIAIVAELCTRRTSFLSTILTSDYCRSSYNHRWNWLNELILITFIIHFDGLGSLGGFSSFGGSGTGLRWLGGSLLCSFSNFFLHVFR